MTAYGKSGAAIPKNSWNPWMGAASKAISSSACTVGNICCGRTVTKGQKGRYPEMGGAAEGHHQMRRQWHFRNTEKMFGKKVPMAEHILSGG